MDTNTCAADLADRNIFGADHSHRRFAWRQKEVSRRAAVPDPTGSWADVRGPFLPDLKGPSSFRQAERPSYPTGRAREMKSAPPDHEPCCRKKGIASERRFLRTQRPSTANPRQELGW